jgi:nucleotide-binding universal stress UspA family protein
MLRILIPVDFSDYSTSVCKYAVNLINTDNTELHIFHILPDGVMVPDSSFPAGIDSDAFLNKEYMEQLRLLADKNMTKIQDFTKALARKSRFKNISITSSIISGDAEWEIMNICTKFTPKVLVMGTKGLGNKGFMQGSMAKNIMNKVHIPVIAVPETCNHNKPGNIMYATNFSDKDYMKIRLLFTLFKNLDIKLFVTHFDIIGNDNTVNKKIDNLQEAFQFERSKGKIYFNIIDSNDKDISLRTFCEEYEIDMISFISYKSSIFHNLFSNEIHKKDFFKLSLPMLALHE